MNDTGRIVATAALVTGGVYLLFKMREAQIAGRPLTLPSLFPSNPSKASPANIGAGTNLFMEIPAALERALSAFKLPGNTTSAVAKPSSPGVPTMGWTLDPGSSLIPPPPLNPTYGTPGQYIPNMGDPNYSAWDYLASTPPDLAWTLTPSMVQIPPPPGSYESGVPDLGWTLHPSDTFIPPPPAVPQQGSRISIVGLG